MRIKDRIAAEKKAARELLAKGEDNLTDEEFESLKEHVAEAKKLEERVKLFADANKDIDEKAGAPRSRRRPRSMGEFVVASVKDAGMTFSEAKAKGFETAEFKAASDAQVTTDKGEDEVGYAPYLSRSTPRCSSTAASSPSSTCSAREALRGRSLSTRCTASSSTRAS